MMMMMMMMTTLIGWLQSAYHTDWDISRRRAVTLLYEQMVGRLHRLIRSRAIDFCDTRTSRQKQTNKQRQRQQQFRVHRSKV